MKIGTLGYRTKTGLGYQVLSYVKHLPIEKVMVVNLNPHNGLPLTDWYESAQTVIGYPRPHDISAFLEGLDAVLLAETPLNYDLYAMARARGIKTAVVANWEFWDYYLKPDLPLPDLLIMPSMWRLDEAQQFALSRGIKCIQLHHPVDRDEFPFKLRTTKKFLHIAGNPAIHDRNGTFDYLRACPDGKLVTQNERFGTLIRNRYRQSKVYINVEDPNYMYQMGDILVFPRRYGGNCLPLNEALSTGMPVIMPDISPNNHLLPPEWLVPANKEGTFSPRTIVDLYRVDHEALAQRLDWFRACDIEAESRRADAIAETISWQKLGPMYLKALEEFLS